MAAGSGCPLLEAYAQGRAVEVRLDIVRGDGVAAEHGADVTRLDEAGQMRRRPGVDHSGAGDGDRQLALALHLAQHARHLAHDLRLRLLAAHSRGHELERLALARPFERDHANTPVTRHKEVTGLRVAHRRHLRRARHRTHADAAVHLRVRHTHPLAAEPHERLEIGARVEALGEHAIHGCRRERHVLRRHCHNAELGDRREQLVEVRRIAPEDPHHGMRGILLHAPDLEAEHLEVAVEVHDLVHDLRHQQGVDEMALDLDILVWLVGHRRLRALASD